MQKIFVIFGVLAAILFSILFGLTQVMEGNSLPLIFERNSVTPNTEIVPTDNSAVPAGNIAPTTTAISIKKESVSANINIPEVPVKKIIESPGALIVTKEITTSSTTTPDPIATSTTVATIESTTVPSGVGQLNPRDIILLTNSERTKEGFSTLTFNTHLTMMAEAKARDMIKNNYFAHVSPTGIDVAMLSREYGYAYLNIGENLALGDFVSSQEVVGGWMNSPGHRANILNKSYTEIGVATIVGAYNGRTVWFAVQEFGRPMSDCPVPDLVLKEKIAKDQEHIRALETSLTSLKAEIDTPGISPKTYNEKVGEYNAIVGLFNDLVTTNKKDVTDYNKLTDAYNVCIIAP